MGDTIKAKCPYCGCVQDVDVEDFTEIAYCEVENGGCGKVYVYRVETEHAHSIKVFKVEGITEPESVPITSVAGTESGDEATSPAINQPEYNEEMSQALWNREPSGFEIVDEGETDCSFRSTCRHIGELTDALMWAGNADDFASADDFADPPKDTGKSRPGWLNLCVPLLKKYRSNKEAASAQRVEELINKLTEEEEEPTGPVPTPEDPLTEAELRVNGGEDELKSLAYHFLQVLYGRFPDEFRKVHWEAKHL